MKKFQAATKNSAGHVSLVVESKQILGTLTLKVLRYKSMVQTLQQKIHNSFTEKTSRSNSDRNSTSDKLEFHWLFLCKNLD